MKFFHSSQIKYGPLNSPQTPESAVKAAPLLIGTIGAALAADALNRGSTDPKEANTNAVAAAEKARKAYDRAQESIERYATIVKNNQKPNSQQSESLVSSTVREEKISAVLEAQAMLERAKLIAEEQEKLANDLLDKVDRMSSFEAVSQSYRTSGDIFGARQLDSAASQNITKIEQIVRSTDEMLKQLDNQGPISSIIESKFFDFFTFF